MFAHVNVRLDKLQVLLMLLVQREINDPSFLGSFGLARRCATEDEVSSNPYPESNALFRGSDAFSVLVASTPTSFDVAGVFIQSILLQTARATDRQPFVANLLATEAGGGTMMSARDFSVGVQIMCAIDLRVRRGALDAGLRFVTTWLLGTTSSTLFTFGPADQSLARPRSTVVRYAEDLENGVPIPPMCSMGSPLCRLASELEGVTRAALETAFQQLPSFVSGLGEILPNPGTPINEAIFVTGPEVGTGAGPLTAAEEQFRYVAQSGWGSGGRLRHASSFNSRALAAWRTYLVNRPLGGIPATQDLVVEADVGEVARGVQFSLADSLFQSFSTIEFNLWKGLYFGELVWATAEEERTARIGAAGTLRTFRGDPTASTDWLRGIPRPWGDVVTRLAASRQDTARLTGTATFSEAAGAIETLERRLFGHLASFFEGLPALTGGDALLSDTTPPVQPPPLSDFGAAFILTSFPALTAPFTPRQAYEDFRQLHILLTTSKPSPTREARDQARAELRTAFTNCPLGFGLASAPDLGVSTATPGLGPPLPTPPIGMVPGAGEALDRLFADPQFADDRRQSMLLHAYRDRLLLSRQRFPLVLDPAVRSVLEDARGAANRFLERMGTAPCRANTFLVAGEDPEPVILNRVNLLRLIDIMDGRTVFSHLDENASGRRNLARGFRNVSFFEDGGDPFVTVEPAPHGVVIRFRFALRLAGILAEFPVPIDDLVLFGNTTTAIELVPDGTSGALALRIAFQPNLSFPLERQPGGVALFVFSVLLSIILPTFASILFSIALGSLTSGTMNDVAYFGVGAPGLSLSLLLNEILSDHPEYADRLARALPDVSSQIESLLGGLLGPNFALPDPIITSDPYRVTYTIPNFEDAFLRRIDTSLADNLAGQSFSPTLDLSSERARFYLRAPSGSGGPNLFNIASTWPGRGLQPHALALSFPIVDRGAGWDVCQLLVESRAARVIRFPSTDPMVELPPLPSSLQITLRADLTVLSGLIPTLRGISFEGAAFSMIVATGVATVQAVLFRTEMGRETSIPVPLPTMARPLPLSAPPGPQFRLLIRMPALAWLQAMGVGPGGESVSRQTSRVVLISNQGRFVADFSEVFGRVTTWAPVLFNLRSPEARTKIGELELLCNEERLRRMLTIPVGNLGDPLPPDLFARDFPSGLVPDLGRVLPFGVTRSPFPLPTPDEPRPISPDRPWLFGASASPVPRLDSIADLALRALRPQPLTPSA